MAITYTLKDGADVLDTRTIPEELVEAVIEVATQANLPRKPTVAQIAADERRRRTEAIQWCVNQPGVCADYKRFGTPFCEWHQRRTGWTDQQIQSEGFKALLAAPDKESA